MKTEYKVEAFIPTVKGCGARDKGWDEERCAQYADFLNTHAKDGWTLHSSEFRRVVSIGCTSSIGERLICVFEKSGK